VRAGKSTKNVHSVFVKEFRDPQGFTVYANITGVEANQGELGCACRPTATNKCSCIPDAQVMQGGRFVRVFPLLGPNPARTQPLALGGRVYRIYFRGISAQTGLTCDGYTELCVVKRAAVLRPGQALPQCAPFASTATVRDATVCGRASRDGGSSARDDGKEAPPPRSPAAAAAEIPAPANTPVVLAVVAARPPGGDAPTGTP
jgi:hypothetical protein